MNMLGARFLFDQRHAGNGTARYEDDVLLRTRFGAVWVERLDDQQPFLPSFLLLLPPVNGLPLSCSEFRWPEEEGSGGGGLRAALNSLPCAPPIP